MKKLVALTLAVLTVFSFTTVALADNTTVLTTTVPDAEYTLNIPADQVIEFGTTKTEIDAVTVTDSTGFATGKNLAVKVTYDAFACENVSTTIPFMLTYKYPGAGLSNTSDLPSESIIAFLGQTSGAVSAGGYHFTGTNYTAIENYYLEFESESWGKALGGDYTATITFTAEVVVE